MGQQFPTKATTTSNSRNVLLMRCLYIVINAWQIVFPLKKPSTFSLVSPDQESIFLGNGSSFRSASRAEWKLLGSLIQHSSVVYSILKQPMPTNRELAGHSFISSTFYTYGEPISISFDLLVCSSIFRKSNSCWFNSVVCCFLFGLCVTVVQKWFT